jgi:hypothetical protein
MDENEIRKKIREIEIQHFSIPNIEYEDLRSKIIDLDELRSKITALDEFIFNSKINSILSLIEEDFDKNKDEVKSRLTEMIEEERKKNI